MCKCTCILIRGLNPIGMRKQLWLLSVWPEEFIQILIRIGILGIYSMVLQNDLDICVLCNIYCKDINLNFFLTYIMVNKKYILMEWHGGDSHS